jgi:hypothetical protein
MPGISFHIPRRRVDMVNRLILLFDEDGHLQVQNAKKVKRVSTHSVASIHIHKVRKERKEKNEGTNGRSSTKPMRQAEIRRGSSEGVAQKKGRGTAREACGELGT